MPQICHKIEMPLLSKYKIQVNTLNREMDRLQFQEIMPFALLWNKKVLIGKSLTLIWSKNYLLETVAVASWSQTKY